MTLAFSLYVAYKKKSFYKIHSFCIWAEVLSELIDLVHNDFMLGYQLEHLANSIWGKKRTNVYHLYHKSIFKISQGHSITLGNFTLHKIKLHLNYFMYLRPYIWICCNILAISLYMDLNCVSIRLFREWMEESNESFRYLGRLNIFATLKNQIFHC